MSMFRVMALAAFLAAVVVTVGSTSAAEPSGSGGWPNFLGPNRNGVVESSVKLLEKWPEKGPKLVWISGELPEVPYCGTSSPIVHNGRVYVYAHTLVPMDGVYPFRELLNVAGYPGDMPPDLLKAVDEVRLGAEYKQAISSDRKNAQDAADKFIDKFLSTLDPAQAKKYGAAIRGRIYKGDKLPSDAEYEWLLARKDQEVKTRQEFMQLMKKRYTNNHSGFSSLTYGPVVDLGGGFANKVFERQVYTDDLHCLDAGTGKEIWKQTCPGNFESYGYDFKCSGTPAVADGRVFLRGSGGLHCMDAASGKVLWEAKGSSSSGSAVVAGGTVFCYMPELAAFDAQTGRELWREPKARHTFQTPALWVHGGKTYVLGVDGGRVPHGAWFSDASKIFCLDAGAGKILWEAPGAGSGTKASPVVAGDIVALRGGNFVAYSLSPEKATPLWKGGTLDDNGGTTAIPYKGHIYCMGRTYSDTFFQVLDLKDGKTVKKTARREGTRIGGDISTPIITTDGIAFTVGVSDRGRAILAFKATPDKYEEIGAVTEAPKKGSTFGLLSTVALADGRLYVRLTDALACYDVSSAGQ